MIGKTIAHYKVVDKLGGGGMGVVYKALDTTLDRPVALKFLLESAYDNPDARERFLREARAASALNHPHICVIHELGEHEGRLYIAMELLDGQTLEDRLRQTPFGIDEILLVALQLSDALDAAHLKGIIHRDLKPANIFVTARGDAKILDFGLARFDSRTEMAGDEASTAMLTAHGAILGTAAYMSPEQAEGKAADQRSDLFSFGVVLYEMATGRRPFVGDSPLATVTSILRDDPTPIAERRPDLPPDLGRIVSRCLEKKPEGRYQAARELVDELRRIQLGLRGGPAPASVRPEVFHPARATPFVGRRREVAELLDLLGREDVRLVTLTGPGGIGKTRLSLEVAADLQDQFEDGVAIVDLAAIRDPERVPSTIASRLDVAEQTDEATTETLKKHLRDKQMLLVLDNFEQIVEAAPLIGDLVAAASRLKVIITSRELLRLSLEHNYEVPPLGLPVLDRRESVDAISHYEAVALFIQRAKAVKPAFEIDDDNAPVIAGICVRLDGLPLAIELAAARVAIFSPRQLLERLRSCLKTVSSTLRDLPDRQRTLRGTIDWSYDLLADDEKKLFARLAVFQGGRTLEAAEAVCAGGVDGSSSLRIDVADGLESLVHKSLLRQTIGRSGEPRFEMLETIYEYARERLSELDELGDLHRLHTDFFASMAEEAEPVVNTGEFATWKPRFEDEAENILTALERSLAGDDIGPGIRLLVAMCAYWYPAGEYALFQEWINLALERVDEVPAVLKTRFLLVAGQGAFFQHDREQAGKYCQQALTSALADGDKVQIAQAYKFLMMTAMGVCEPDLYELSKTWLRKTVEISEELGDINTKAQALNNMGEIARSNNDYVTAKRVYEESLLLYRKTENKLRISLVTANLGQVAQQDGDYQAAKDCARQALVLSLEIDNLWLTADIVRAVAPSFGLTGQPKKAARLYGAHEAICESIGARIQPGDLAQHERGLTEVRALVDAEEFEKLWAEGRAMSVGEATSYVLTDDS